jgi:hypothetical protein
MALPVIRDGGHSTLAGAMRATVERTVRLDPVPDDLAAAVITLRRELMNGALETIECVRRPVAQDFK